MGTKDSYDPAYQVILEGLIDLRKAKGLTQTDVAAAMGTDQSQVSKFERRERRLDIIDYLRYCLALGVDPGDLLGKARQLLESERR